METQNTEVSLPDTNNLSVQNFSVSDDLIKNLHNSPEVGTNLIKDMNTYNNKNDNVDPQILLKQYSEENKKQDAEFKERNQSMIDFDERNKEENLNV